MKTKWHLLIHAIGRYLVTHSEKQMGAERKGRLLCNDCGRAIHRGDRFSVLSARHRDCMDPRKVGQMAMEMRPDFPKTLAELIDGD